MSYEIEIEKACEEGDLARVRGLYQSIASSAPEDGTLEMMILTAAENNHPDLVRFCIEQGAEASHDVITEAYDLPEVAKVLITTGAMDVNYDYEMAGDLLINAVYARQYDYVNWLLAHGANPNSGHLMTDSTSALTAAASLGLQDLVTLLIAHGAFLSGRGAAAAAAAHGHTELLRSLIMQGADINELGVRDVGDRSRAGEEGAPLHNAASRGDLRMARMLVQMGARGDLRDRMGRTPLDRAREGGMGEVVGFLEGLGFGGQGGNGRFGGGTSK